MASLQRLFVPAALVAIVTPTSADDLPTDEPTAADVTTAPVPGDETGRLDTEPGDSPARVIARGALLLPRTIFIVAFKPIEGIAWFFDRYQLDERYYQFFWNDARTAGVFPIISLQSGYGINIGAKVIHRDIFGASEKLSLSASTGGEFRTLIKGGVRTGGRFDPLELSLDARFEQKPQDAFYGIGNGNLGPMRGPIDPTMDDTAREVRYRDRLGRVTASTDIHFGHPFHVIASAAYSDHQYSAATSGAAIEQVYAMNKLTGFEGTRHGYSELELRYDTRSASNSYEAPAVPSTGSLLAAYGGIALAIEDSSSDYGRVGIDAQQFFRLAEGPRVLAFRARAEAVTGGLDEVPFTDLPRLGGKQNLRGYPLDRFRDRVAAVGSVEYTWDLTRVISASLFIDAGRVYRSIEDISLEDLRVGYGVGLEVHSDRSFIGRVSLASSIDGGVFLDFSVDPIFDLDRRVDRR